MLKAFVSLLLLAGSTSAFAASFDPSKEIFCAVAVGAYNEAQKLTLSPVNAKGLRNINAFKVGKFENACSASNGEIECSFRSNGVISRKYTLLIGERTAYVDDGVLKANAFIMKSGATEWEVVCEQRL